MFGFWESPLKDVNDLEEVYTDFDAIDKSDTNPTPFDNGTAPTTEPTPFIIPEVEGAGTAPATTPEAEGTGTAPVTSPEAERVDSGPVTTPEAEGVESDPATIPEAEGMGTNPATTPEAGGDETDPSAQASAEAAEIASGLDLFKSNPKTFEMICCAICSGMIPFANSTTGKLFLFLLLQTVGEEITSFSVIAHGKRMYMPIINGKEPGRGGLPVLAWRFWKIAVKFPDRVGFLSRCIPAAMFSSDVTFETLTPEIQAIIIQLEALKVRKGKVAYKAAREHARLVKLSGVHDPEAIDEWVKAQYGEGLLLSEVIQDHGRPRKGGQDIIRLVSVSKQSRCPHCGKISNKRTQGGARQAPRIVQDCPMRDGYSTYVEIYSVKSYVCENEECPQEGFTETFDFVLPYKHFTIKLCGTVLAMAALTSYHGGQELWKLSGISISDCTIRRLVLALTFEDDPDIEEIGLDDVAKRKGMSYYTIIYAVKDHRLLAIVDGRDGSELIKWLNNHKKVRLICRDRASAYSAAIDKWATANGVETIEIADRFHLIQNMIEKIGKYYLSILPLRFAIIVDGNSVRIVEGKEIPHKKAYAKSGKKPSQERLDKMQYDNSPPLDDDGNPIEFEVPGNGKESQESNDAPMSSELNQEDGTEHGPSEETDGQDPAPSEVTSRNCDGGKVNYDTVCAIRAEFDPIKPRRAQYKALAEKHGLDPTVVGRYCRMTLQEVEGLQNNPTTATTEKDSKEPGEPDTAAPEPSETTGSDYEVVRAVRNDFNPSQPKRGQYKALAEKYGLDPKTVGRYCRMKYEEVEGLKDSPTIKNAKKRPKKPRKPKAKKIDKHKYIIYKMFRKGYSATDIFWKIRSLTGDEECTLTDEGLLKDILAIYGLVCPNSPLPDTTDYLEMKYDEGVYVIRRCELLKYLVTVNPKTKKNKILETYEDLILNNYQSVSEVKTIFREFYDAIMGDDETAIDRFISQHAEGELKRFCQSLSHDIEAIKNAVRFTYSSGMVEGNNAKFKLLKRVSGGRLTLNSLYQKCMLGFWYTLDDFDLSEVAPWLNWHREQ